MVRVRHIFFVVRCGRPVSRQVTFAWCMLTTSTMGEGMTSLECVGQFESFQEIETWGFNTEGKIASDTLPKTNMSMEHHHLKRGYIFIRCWFSIAMLVFYTPEVPQLKPLTNKSWKPLLSFGESSGGELLNFQGNYLHLDSSDPKKSGILRRLLQV